MKASGSNSDETVPDRELCESQSQYAYLFCCCRSQITLLQIQRGSHIPQLFLQGLHRQIRREQNTEVTKTGISFEASVFVLLWKSWIRTSSQPYSFKLVSPAYYRERGNQRVELLPIQSNSWPKGPTSRSDQCLQAEGRIHADLTKMCKQASFHGSQPFLFAEPLDYSGCPDPSSLTMVLLFCPRFTIL